VLCIRRCPRCRAHTEERGRDELGDSSARPFQLAPTVLGHLNPKSLRRSLDTPPRSIAVRVTGVFDLITSDDGVSHVLCVGERDLSLLRERERRTGGSFLFAVLSRDVFFVTLLPRACALAAFVAFFMLRLAASFCLAVDIALPLVYAGSLSQREAMYRPVAAVHTGASGEQRCRHDVPRETRRHARYP